MAIANLIFLSLWLNMMYSAGLSAARNEEATKKVLVIDAPVGSTYISADPRRTLQGECDTMYEFYDAYGGPCTRDCVIYQLGGHVCRAKNYLEFIPGCYCFPNYVRAGRDGPCVTTTECLEYDLIMEYITGLYGCMFLVGLLGNGSLGLTLCCGPGARARSPLLLGLVAADFLVCCLSGPVTATLYLVSTWSQPWLRVALFVQAWPVSASTLSMMAISVDRYLTVKNYRPAGQVVRRRHLLATTSAVAWLLAAALSSLQILQRSPWRTSVLIAKAIIVHILPICVVFASHLGVHSKLTALSLTARAKHGELPLPMPLLRRPTNVIIVAGISTRIDNKPLGSVQSGQQKAELDAEANEQPPTSTLQSRRRLANALMWMAAVFAGCWLPHVVCTICNEFSTPPSASMLRYSLFLGHVHSAFSPLLYWTLNHRWLQPPCRFRLPVLYRNASSTNEAALGPFNPRFARPPPVRRQSSHYLY